ncbi:MAG: hypothetical protein MAG795_01035 [Candidatus Woesearchaeota archaeon]|nr:hypothetical protein [Candidatus Woesearchaeota archaeon]
MDKRQKILHFIRMRGPSLPVHVSKQIDTNILMASAIISEMVSRGELKVSNLKVGGSPLYYIKGQEKQLEKFKDKLNPKDRRTLEMLKEKKVVRDSALQPIERVSLRRIKDFAKPLNVRVGENKEIFWKWHLISHSQAQDIIQSMFKKAPQIKKPIAKKVNKEPETQAQETARKDVEEKKPEPKKEEQEKAEEEQPEAEKKEQSETKKDIKKSKKELKKQDDTEKDSFFGQISKFFAKKDIEILKSEIIRKGSEVDLIIKIPSNLGDLKYYCKAKSKKRNNGTDLAAALVQGQTRKLPVVYLTKGRLTRKAKDKLEEEFNALKLIKME